MTIKANAQVHLFIFCIFSTKIKCTMFSKFFSIHPHSLNPMPPFKVVNFLKKLNLINRSTLCRASNN